MILQFIAAMAGTWAFAVLYHAPKRYYLAGAVNGAIGWICYLALMHMGMGYAGAIVLSTIVLSLVSRILAVVMRAPGTIFLVTGIFPLVPGAGIYYSVYYFMQQDLAMGGAKAVEVMTTAGAIAMGILIGSMVPQRFFAMFGRKNDIRTKKS